jgi:soluble lytic murein transglycosylase-like protein
VKTRLGVVCALSLFVGVTCAASAAGPNSTVAQQVDPIVRKIAARFRGIDPALVHSIIAVESNYNPLAVSDKGAQGLMQLMPETASFYGVKDVFNSRDNIEGGIKYLSDLLRAYPSRTDLVLAAYNAGRSAVDKYKGIPPFPETQNYVARVKKIFKASLPAVRKSPIYAYKDKQGKLRVTNVVVLMDGDGTERTP